MTAPRILGTIKQGESLIPLGKVLTYNGTPVDLTDTNEWGPVTGRLKPTGRDSVYRDFIFLDEELAEGLVRPRLDWEESETGLMQPGQWRGDARVFSVTENRPRFLATVLVIVEDAITEYVAP